MLDEQELAPLALTEQEKLILYAVLAAAMIFVVFFEMRVMRKKSRDIRRVSQRKDEAFNAVLTTRSVIGVIRRQGGDASAAEALVSSAKRAMERGEYDKCMDLCDQARSELTNPSARRSELAPAPVSDADKDRLERVAENILSSKVVSSADTYKGTKLSADQDGNYLSAKFEMNTARADIKKASEMNIDTSRAQDLMTDAEAAFVTGNYTRAMSLAVKARKSVSSEASSETIRLKAAKEPVGPSSDTDAEELPGEPVLACGKCESPIDADDKFCPKCGTKVLRERVCKSCGSKPKPSDMFCRRCGARIG